MAVHLTDETAPLFWPCASTRYWNYTHKWSLVCTFRLIWKRPQISFYRYIKCFLTLSGKISVILEWILGQSSYQQQSRKKRTNLFFSLPPPPPSPTANTNPRLCWAHSEVSWCLDWHVFAWNWWGNQWRISPDTHVSISSRSAEPTKHYC